MLKLREEAAEIAAPYLAKNETQIVIVNQHGLVWVNNTEADMKPYFAAKKQNYWVFEKEGATAPEPKKGKK